LKIDSWPARFLIEFAYYLLKIWARTLRFEIEDRIALVTSPVRENYIGALWHNRLLLISYALKRFVPHRPGAGLVSASRDGDLVAALTKRFRFDVVRGSTSRMGAGALRELSGVLDSHLDVLMTRTGREARPMIQGRVRFSSRKTARPFCLSIWSFPSAGD
jgi:lysophospholipid acyltransferase (LPLAT)-like uncharacterized protein